MNISAIVLSALRLKAAKRPTSRSRKLPTRSRVWFGRSRFHHSACLAKKETKSMSVTSQYVVSGMHCGHCVNSVTEEVSAVSEVTDVEVDLDSGRLTVVSNTEIPLQSIEAAVDEAGYSLATA